MTVLKPLNAGPMTLSEPKLFIDLDDDVLMHIDRNFDTAQDGRLLFVKRKRKGQTPHIVYVKNWVAEIDRLVPPFW